MSGHKEIVDTLIEAGTSLLRDFRQEMEVKLIHYAAHGDLKRLTKLVQAGIRVDAKDDEGGTALQVSLENGQMAVVDFLLSHGATMDDITDDLECDSTPTAAPMGQYDSGGAERGLLLLSTEGSACAEMRRAASSASKDGSCPSCTDVKRRMAWDEPAMPPD
jgi:hypothetical protein